MAPPDLFQELSAIDQMLEAGDFDSARAALDAIDSPDLAVEVLRIKLALFNGTLPPPLAMQRLIQVMRKDANVERGKELYQEASNRAYQDRQSSVSHSHPPPPVRPVDSEDKE